MTDPHPLHGPSPDPSGSPPAADPALRRMADAEYRRRTAALPDPFEASFPEAARAVLQELRVHQIELEMQNEELRRTQVELAATRARYFDLFDLAPVGYLIVRESGLILQANLTAAAMLGVVRSALTDRPVSRSILRADQNAWYLCRKRLVDTGEPQSCELRVVKPDGPDLWVRVAISAACADDGTPLHRVTLTDISESKRADQIARVAAAQAAAAAVAAGVAHEFGGLLFAISLAVARSTHAGPDSGPDSEGSPAALARDMIREAQTLAGSLLDLYASPDRVAPRLLPFYPWLSDTVSQLTKAVPTGIRVTTEVEFDLPEAVAHALGLEQVLRNLLFNAVDALGEAGEIRVRAARAVVEGRDVIEVRVSDNGPGIPEDLRARIFEPGFSTRPKSHRSGLGLAIAVHMLAQFGGTIAYEPGSPRGSTFVIRLAAFSGEDE